MAAHPETEEQINHPKPGILDQALRTPVAKTTIRTITGFLIESSSQMVKVNGRENIKLLDGMLTPRTLLLIASGHQNHADALISYNHGP